jgi:hypothetical protein
VLDEVQDATRLTVRARIAYTPVGLPAPLIRILVSSGFGVGDVIQAGTMLSGIRQRVEQQETQH